MFERLKKLFKPADHTPKPMPEEVKKVKKPRKVTKPVELSPKEIATAAGEPYIAILKVDLDPNNINNGAFELDWNDKFVLNLVKSGYKLKPTDKDNDVVDRWFQTVCRNVALEVYEQDQADPDNRYHSDMRVVQSKDIGNGRSEIS